METTDLVPVEQSTALESWEGAAARGLAAREERAAIIRKVLVKGQDFGTIPGCGPKPTLLKPGAEKIADSLNLWPDYEEIQRVEDWDKPLFFYRYRCILRQRGPNVQVASGVGSCNSRERKYVKRDAADVLNTIDKMAQKRALVAAALNLGFSDHFTQDLEDVSSAQVPSDAAPAPQGDLAWDDSAPPVEISNIKRSLHEELVEFSPKQRDALVRKYSQIIEDGKPALDAQGQPKCIESLEKALSDKISEKWVAATLGKIREARKTAKE